MTITPAVFTPERSENVSTLWSPTSSQTKGDCFTSTSLLGEGRRHIQALQEALLHLPHISASEERQLLPPNSVASAEPKSASTASSPSEGGGGEGQSNATVKQSTRLTATLDMEMIDKLREQVRQASKDTYWPR